MEFLISDTNDEVLAEIGRRIAALRLSFNWSQQELASRAGVSKRSVERMEQGIGNPNLKVFIALCAALRLTPNLEALLPAVTLTPQQIFAKEKLRVRAGRRKTGAQNAKWGTHE